MAVTNRTRNELSQRKRHYEQLRASSSSLSPVTQGLPKPKKPKRAETRPCPVCGEHIPLRLLGVHSELESERLEEIIRNVGSTDCILTETDNGSSSSSRTRRSAIKARQSLTSRNASDSLGQAGKAIQSINRRRRQRHARLRDMARQEDEEIGSALSTSEIVCPVCLVTVRGDQDVLDAHVDACLANESRRLEEERREQELRQNIDLEMHEYPDDVAGDIGDVRGTGFHTRNRNEQDVDDVIDVDGDDDAFGDAQFTEGDILPVDRPEVSIDEDVEVEIEVDVENEAQHEQKTLRDLVAEGKKPRSRSASEHPNRSSAKLDTVPLHGDDDKTDIAIQVARRRGDKVALISALETKVEQLESLRASSLTCRICLDPYSEPTTSTGCWHTCCRECWLRCLGSTKLCPICKRITSASDLRRIYL